MQVMVCKCTSLIWLREVCIICQGAWLVCECTSLIWLSVRGPGCAGDGLRVTLQREWPGNLAEGSPYHLSGFSLDLVVQVMVCERSCIDCVRSYALKY